MSIQDNFMAILDILLRLVSGYYGYVVRVVTVLCKLHSILSPHGHYCRPTDILGFFFGGG